MQIELSVYDTIYNLFNERKIIKYKPIHRLLPSYPEGFYPRVDLGFDSGNHVFKIKQGIIAFFAYKSTELDSIQKVVMKDLVIVLTDKDSIEYKLYPCK